jgi:hypothetical protein
MRIVHVLEHDMQGLLARRHNLFDLCAAFGRHASSLCIDPTIRVGTDDLPASSLDFTSRRGEWRDNGLMMRRTPRK